MINHKKFRRLVERAVDRNAPGAQGASGELWELIGRPVNKRLRELRPDFGRLTRASQDDLRDEFLCLIENTAAGNRDCSFEVALQDVTRFWYMRMAHGRE